MLTDLAIKSLKPAAKPQKRSDSGGLFILVQPNGARLWRLAYRFGGKQKLLALGIYPETSLAEARKRREEAKQLLRVGVDPSEARKNERRAVRLVAENSFEVVARAWLATRAPSWSPRYAALVQGRLEADVFPMLGATPIGEIDPPTLLDAIRKIEQRGSIEMARRVKNHCSEIFRFAIAEKRCTSDPARDLSAALTRPAPVRHRAKVEAKELSSFFAQLNQDEGERLSHLALRWTILTMVRTQETRFAQWNEFEGLGTKEALWRIPAKRMKMRSEHIVPLAPQAEALLAEIRDLNLFAQAGNARLGGFLFPVASSKSGVISENRMLDIMYRLGLRGKATVHGFRGLASTVLNESGEFEADWIEAQLAHTPRGVRAAYNAAKYLRQRREMMLWWANYLDAAEARSREVPLIQAA